MVNWPVPLPHRLRTTVVFTFGGVLRPFFAFDFGFGFGLGFASRPAVRRTWVFLQTLKSPPWRISSVDPSAAWTTWKIAPVKDAD